MKNIVCVLAMLFGVTACGHPERIYEMPMQIQPSSDEPAEAIRPGEAPRSNLGSDRLDAVIESKPNEGDEQ